MRLRLPIRRSPDVLLYSRANCPLCRTAERHVRRAFGPARVAVIDIEGNRELEDRYLFRVPVLFRAGDPHGDALAEGAISLDDARAARARAVARGRDDAR